MRQFFTTHSHSWRDVGLARELSRRAVKRARIQSLVLLPVLVGVLVVYGYRDRLFGPAYDDAVRIVTFLALIALGWQFARDVGRALGPTLFRRMDPGTAGTVGFLLRLATMLVAVLIALRIAGLGPRTLALGGAFTAVVVGLAAQQTLGNLFAGMVLLSARVPRGRAGAAAGRRAGRDGRGCRQHLGLLYTTLASGDDAIMVPNSVVLNVAIVPLREPDGIDLRARLRPGVTPTRHAGHAPAPDRDADAAIRRASRSRARRRRGRGAHHGDPRTSHNGPRLASEVLEVVAARRCAPRADLRAAAAAHRTRPGTGRRARDAGPRG